MSKKSGRPEGHILVEKDENIAEVIERISEVKGDEVVLVIPKGSSLSDSESNFRLLAREEHLSKKHIVIESVDDEVLSYAKEHGIESIHPLFDEQAEKKLFSDIVPASRKKKKTGGRKAKKEKEAEEEIEEEDEEQPEDEEVAFEEELEEPRARRRRRLPTPSRRATVVISVIVVILGGFFWVTGTLLARAEITLNFEKVPWGTEERFVAAAAVKNGDAVRNLISAQFFEEKKSTTQFFPASGRDRVEERAQGTVTIYNEYSSQSQILVATTRFETPDGKIFRLNDRIVVPGAKIVNGQIEASNIKATVTADKAGPEYNVGQIARLHIPGFEGSPRYEGFYGMFEEGTRGGFIGEKAVPTDKDVEEARARVEEILRTAFRSTFLYAIPGELMVPEGATSFELGNIAVDRTTDEEGRFSALGSANFRALAFRQDDVIALLNRKVKETDADAILADVSLDYTDVTSDFEEKEVAFMLVAEGVTMPEFDSEEFLREVAGIKEREVRKVIRSLPDLSDARVSLWPLWRRSMPDNLEKIQVTVE